MTIKKQFIILSSLLFIIPLSCVVFMLVHHYVMSSQRLVVKPDNHTEREFQQHFTKNELAILKKYFDGLPPDVDGVLINKDKDSEDFVVLMSSIRAYHPGDKLQLQDIWSIVQQHTEDFFYQFSSPSIHGNDISIMITRIPKHAREEEKKPFGPNTIYYLLAFLFVIVAFILFTVILLSKNIFKSISMLEKSTQAIANGDLNTQIDLGEESFKDNEITNIAKSLEQMRLSLVEASNRKIKLIMGISHDLRTPVAVIKGYTEGLKDGIITSKSDVQNALTLIETKTNQLEEMIDSLLNYTKMSTTEIRNTLMPNSITKLINEFFEDCTNSIEVFKRKLVTDYQLKDDIIIPLDVQLAQRALLNLYNNSVRYTRDNDTITISAIQQEKQIVLSIADTGIGISAEDLPHIFDLFYRATSSRREEGMGIGLAVVKNIINIHNWDISVVSELNKGTTFTITIPY